MADQDSQEAEWSQVKRKGGRLRNITAPENSLVSDGNRPNPKPELSENDLESYHKSLLARDSAIADLLGRVDQALRDAYSATPVCTPITTAVLLGPGPYEPSTGSSTARRTAHVQTAVFLSFVAYLEKQTGQTIKCVVQEPRFTSTDKEFCKRLGFDAVDSPAAFDLVGENTLLFAIHMELDVYIQALTKLPGIYVGVGLEKLEKVATDGPDAGPDKLRKLEGVREMEREYAKYAFPELDYMFFNTVMYWKRFTSAQAKGG